MRGNNRGRIFMSLINHVLCLSLRCLHPSCPAALLPSHFKSHSLYHFTNPSERSHESGAIETKKKKKRRTKCFYLFICLRIHHVVLWWPGPAGTQRTEFALWIISAPAHIIFLRWKTWWANSASPELWDCKSFAVVVLNLCCIKQFPDRSIN